MTEYVIDFLIIVVVVMAITGVAEWVSHNIEDPFVRKEIAELQESWAQEAREHADDSARLAELAHENAELKHEIAELRSMEVDE